MLLQLDKLPEEQTELVGQKDIELFFLDLIKNNQIDGSWLFSGPKGIGKATFAYRLAKFLVSHDINNLSTQNISSLQTDSNNREVISVIRKSNPGLKIIERALKPKEQKERDELISKGETLDPNIESKRERFEEIRIDDIRDIDNFLHMTLTGNKKRILIIDSADDMNPQAANALLKSLEEPPKNVIIILISHNIGKLLPTIKSRCRIINFHPLNYNDELNLLGKVFPNKNKNTIHSLSLLSEGSIGNAIELDNLGGVEIYQQIINIYLKKSVQEALNTVEKYSKDKKILHIFKKLFFYFVSHCLLYMTDKEFYQETTSNETLVYTSLQQKKSAYELMDIISKISVEFLDIDLDQKQVCINNIMKIL